MAAPISTKVVTVSGGQVRLVFLATPTVAAVVVTQ